MMWRIYFEVFDFLAGFIPSKKLREYVRRVKLYDYRRKFNALQSAIPNGEFKNIRIIKGGWNIGFIVDNKYVCKIRKFFDKSVPVQKIIREKRITDAFQPIVSLQIPQIDIIESDGLTFYRYNFIPGINLNRLSRRTIVKHGWEWGKQLAEFIYAMHNHNAPEIKDLKDRDGDGWNHNDICNNIIVDQDTMKIVGIIDWEYAGWGMLDTEFENCTAFSKKMEKSGLGTAIQIHYHLINNRRKK